MHIVFYISGLKNTYGFSFVINAQNHTIVNSYINFGFYIMCGNRFSDSKKIFEWLRTEVTNAIK